QFLVKHPDFYDKLADDFGEIDYNVASQTFGEDKKYIFYPILKDGKVTSLWYGKLKEDRSWVDFYLVHDTSASTQRMIGEFQNYYSKKAVSRGEPDPPVKEIPEIVITPPGTNPPINDPLPNTGGGGTYTPPYTGDMSGGSIMHGGGNGTSTTQDPCNKMKAQSTNQEFKDNVKAIDKEEIFKKTEETGIAAAYGPKTTYEPLANTANDNLKFPPGNKYFGYIHSHLDSKDGVVKIFSPADISTFLTSCVRNAKDKGKMTDAYGMVITSQGNYILKYSGDGNYGIGPVQETAWQTWYETEFAKIASEDGSILQNNVEKLFTQFLKEVVKVAGLEVYKSDKTNGSTTKLEYNGKDQPIKTTPCP
ncbi:hypothetical protein, partial [uncultured Chryseobacterium sp.]|uniref:hypothetical protein n=1 Tax=uncultured Chryseobacterium sp. TaxID=259322 RepID=UPI0025900049